jgi:heme/copper-type cytochrome/quinol oxidase subunit 2
MEAKTKDALIKIVGIAGLLLLLVIFSLDMKKSSPPERSGKAGHDHANPAQHGKSLEKKGLNPADTQFHPSGKVEAGKRNVLYEAFRYGFSPDPLVVISGETVELEMKSRDVPHGIMIPEIGFNAEIHPDKTNIASFTAPLEPGKYPVFCSVFCGSDHGDMKGTMIVLPKNSEEEAK